MKHLIRDILIWVISALGFALRYRKQKRSEGPLVRILCFHDVPKHDWFLKVITFCNEQYNVLSPEQFFRKEFSSQKINILFTFDDGYQSWVDVALPALARSDSKGLFFVNSGLLAVAEDKEAVADYMESNLRVVPKLALTDAGVASLITAGHTIGGHTVSHQDLTTLTPETASQEVLQDRDYFTKHFGITPEDFAYPFGNVAHCSETLTQMIVKNGYKRVYSGQTGFFTAADSLIPRTLVEKNQSLRSLRLWIEGGYDIFSRLKN